MAEKPLSANAIAQLAYKLERAERELNQMNDVRAFCGPNWAQGVPADEVERVIAEEDAIRRRLLDAERSYAAAINARDLYDRDKFIGRKTPPRGSDAFALKHAMYSTRAHSDKLHDLGPGFSSVRERIRADYAAMQAEVLFEIAQTKFQDASRKRRADNRAGIVRAFHRRKPQELHL